MAAAAGATEEAVLEALEAGQSYRTSSIDAPDRQEGTHRHRLGDVDAGFAGTEDRMVLAISLARLPERERTILNLRFVEGLTQSEIAAQIGISQMHVSRLLDRQPGQAQGVLRRRVTPAVVSVGRLRRSSPSGGVCAGIPRVPHPHRRDRGDGRTAPSPGRSRRAPAEGGVMPRNDWTDKRERQYEHIKEGLEDRGDDAREAEEIAARTVNKARARAGESKTSSRTSTDDISSGRRGGLRSHRGAGGRTRDQLYEEARRRGVPGRSTMSKAQLERAVGR